MNSKKKTDSRKGIAAQTAAPRKRPAITASEEIYAKLQQAIFEHRLLPGTKLIEERLGEVVGTSRTIIRQVLARMAHEKLVTLIPNRGAYIASPSVAEAREVFVARRLIEPEVVRMLCSVAAPAHLALLRAHVAQESRARAAGDRASIIRLSGEFHVLLASLAGNATLLRIIREMCAQTCLAIALYDKPNAPACPFHEHAGIIDAIERHAPDAAIEGMLQHLDHIEKTLDFNDKTQGLVDWRSIFS
ncbi:GntR family transcriptional regulator [Pollutimonas bauzanensis]|uniref:DNA-binding transcriptional regulator, GntR family n=1 Tax=Pollutimonas bauzanensis TaxID=658167 RepID=A0A1M5ZIX1_9BURK|nr:GntR family transcriptional regulator [Pollutimonas bauzanensis]SHI24275.1 DNA-binding transcriptional regulator, GntR family [Pollutimonas bauzanensis]